MMTIEHSAKAGKDHCDNERPGASADAGDEARLLARIGERARAQRSNHKAGGDEHRPKHEAEYGRRAVESRDHYERKSESSEAPEQPRRARVACGKAVDEPSPEEIADFPAERRQPEDPAELRLRETDDLREVQRREIENHADGQRANSVGGDKAPEAAFEGIRESHASRLGGPGLGRKIHRAVPGEHPDETRDARDDKSRAPPVGQRNRSDDQRRDDRTERS